MSRSGLSWCFQMSSDCFAGGAFVFVIGNGEPVGVPVSDTTGVGSVRGAGIGGNPDIGFVNACRNKLSAVGALAGVGGAAGNPSVDLNSAVSASSAAVGCG